MIGKIGILSFLVLILFSCNPKYPDQVYLFSYFTDNGQHGLHLAYSFDGLNWESIGDGKSFLKPQLGETLLMRDPCIIKGPDDLFHMVWTTGWKDKIIGYASSPDLINWSEQKAIPVMTHEPEAKNSWAPEIFYDEKNTEYLIFWATTIPGRHSFIQKSENDLNHRMYYCTTKDFKIFSNTEIFFNPDFSVIDASIMKWNERYFMFLKNENLTPPEKNIRLTSSNKAAGPYPLEVSEPITGNYWAEGPTAIAIGEYIYVYFDKYVEKKYGAIRSRDMIQWEDISDIVNFPKGLRHGTVFKVDRSVFKGLIKSTAEKTPFLKLNKNYPQCLRRA